MADNYLEKHYEEYLKRKAAWEKSKKHALEQGTGSVRKKAVNLPVR